MKSRSSTRAITILRIAFACLALCFFAPANAADHAGLIAQARQQLLSDHFIEGLAAAKDAVRAKPNDYKGHYYVAMAYMGMGQLDDAGTAVNLALGLAPASAKPGVEKLDAAIKARRQSASMVQEADAAMADGLTGKAARLYEDAWSAGNENPELGLKAARLYVRLNQPVDAAWVLRQVSIAAKGSVTADKAEAELKELSGPLRKAAEGYTKEAYELTCGAAYAKLLQAEEADPSYAEPVRVRAWCAAKTRNFENLQIAIKKYVKLGLAKPEEISKLPNMRAWLSNAPFVQFLADVVGQAGVNATRTLVEERWARYEKDLAKYNEDSASYESRLNAQKQRYEEDKAHYAKLERKCFDKGGFFGSDVAAMECIQRQYAHWHPEWKDIEKPKKPVEPE